MTTLKEQGYKVKTDGTTSWVVNRQGEQVGYSIVGNEMTLQEILALETTLLLNTDHARRVNSLGLTSVVLNATRQ